MTLDKAQPLSRPQFPHLYSQALHTQAVLTLPQAQARMHTQLPPPALPIGPGTAQRHTGTSSLEPMRTCTHRGAHTWAHTCAHGHTVHTSRHPGKQSQIQACRHILIHIDTQTRQAQPTLTLGPPLLRAPPLPTAPTPTHNHAHTHIHPTSAVYQLLVQVGLGERGKKPKTQPGKGCGGVRGRGK